MITAFPMPFQNTLISRLSSAEKSDHFSFMSVTFIKSFYFLRTYVNIIKVLSMRKLSFCFGNRLSYALSKYTNFPGLFRREKRSFSYYISHPYEIFLFFENIDEYYQGSNNALSTVFVLVTAFITPFQNILIPRLSYSKKRDHFSFMSVKFIKSSYFLRTYVNIIKVLATRKLSFCFGNRLSYALSKYTNFSALFRREKRSFSYYISHPYKIFLFFENIDEYYQGSNNGLSTVFVEITDHLMPFQITLIARLSSAEKSNHFSFMFAIHTKSSCF